MNKHTFDFTAVFIPSHIHVADQNAQKYQQNQVRKGPVQKTDRNQMLLFIFHAFSQIPP